MTHRENVCNRWNTVLSVPRRKCSEEDRFHGPFWASESRDKFYKSACSRRDLVYLALRCVCRVQRDAIISKRPCVLWVWIKDRFLRVPTRSWDTRLTVLMNIYFVYLVIFFLSRRRATVLGTEMSRLINPVNSNWSSLQAGRSAGVDLTKSKLQKSVRFSKWKDIFQDGSVTKRIVYILGKALLDIALTIYLLSSTRSLCVSATRLCLFHSYLFERVKQV